MRKTRRPGKILREGAILLQGFRTPAGMDTTSEPRVGNGPPCAPVKAPMSDGESRNQGGTVEYFCIPPLIFRGWVFFIPSPKGDIRYKIQDMRYFKMLIGFGQLNGSLSD